MGQQSKEPELLYHFIPDPDGSVHLRNLLGEVVLNFPSQEAALPLALAYNTYMKQSNQRANDFIAGVIEGISWYNLDLLKKGALKPVSEWNR